MSAGTSWSSAAAIRPGKQRSFGRTSRRVHVLVRGAGLADTMSRYLIRRIEENPRIVLRTRTEIVALEGNAQLEAVQWRDDHTGQIERHPIGNVFMMTGATPNTRWLDGCLALDDKGFIKTGSDLSAAERASAKWTLERSPFLLETSRPGIFAVGDVRRKRQARRICCRRRIAVARLHRASSIIMPPAKCSVVSTVIPPR